MPMPDNLEVYWKTHKRTREFRKKVSDAMKLSYVEGRHKKVWLGKHLSKKTREKSRISHIKLWKDVSLRKQVDRTMTQWWHEHPNIKKIYSERMKKKFLKHPEMFESFMNGGRNASYLDLKSKLGKVRSLGEQKIANFFFYNKIKAKYESIVLLLGSWPCVPDFYLEELNYFVEFYGGHPKSYAKKVIKNKLYKKYRIPVISITPSELVDLTFLTKLKKNKDYRWKKFIVRS